MQAKLFYGIDNNGRHERDLQPLGEICYTIGLSHSRRATTTFNWLVGIRLASACRFRHAHGMISGDFTTSKTSMS